MIKQSVLDKYRQPRNRFLLMLPFVAVMIICLIIQLSIKSDFVIIPYFIALAGLIRVAWFLGSISDINHDNDIQEYREAIKRIEEL